MQVASLKGLSNKLFNIADKQFCFTYIDPEDGERITMCLDEELSEACRLFAAAGKPLTLEVVLEEDSVTEQSVGGQQHQQPAAAIHVDVSCDECGESPIVGDRFKCCVRNDYDLCASCESKNPQPFAMVKIRTPEQAPSALIVGLREDAPPIPPLAPTAGAGGGRRGYPFARGPRASPWGVHVPPPPPGADGLGFGVPLQPHPLPFAHRGFGSGFSGGGRRGGGGPTHEPPAPLQSRFVQDETMPDGSPVPLNSTFEKVWIVRNDGASDWPAGVRLVFVSGDEMAMKLPSDISCRPGQEVRLTATLKAPPMTGRFVSYFRLHGPAGPFGQRYWCDIRSVEPSASTPVVAATTATATATATVAEDYVRVDADATPVAASPAATAAASATAGGGGGGPFDRELGVLRELGFANDHSQLGVLLQDLLGGGSSQSSDERMAGLQRVISTLLHASGAASSSV